MINTFKYLKYSILLPLLFIQFSCDTTEPQDCAGVANGTATIDACGVCGGTGVDTDSDGSCDAEDPFPTVDDATLDLSDVIGSWMLTGLTGTYTYTVDLPPASSGVTWPADTSFGIKIKWEYADAILGSEASQAQFWVPGAEFKEDDVSLYTVATYDLPTMQYAEFGLIGVFEDAPSAGEFATYKMKGQYPGVFYNYSICSTAGSTAPMTDQGLYNWNQSAATENFVIKRDSDIAGSQVLPPFGDGTLTRVDETTLNIKFLDRDSHSELYTQIMDTWDEGKHPDAAYGGTGENSGGDRTYMAFPPLVVDATHGGFTEPADGTNGTPVTSGYFYSITAPYDLTSWGGYMTWYAFCFLGEMQYLAATGTLTDAGGDGSMADDLVGYMVTNNATGVTHGTNMPYSLLVSTAYAITNDSSNDVDVSGAPTSLANGGKMTFNVISDCAAPVDVTIQFDATFTKCTTDNCAGDNYHVPTTWD